MGAGIGTRPGQSHPADMQPLAEEVRRLARPLQEARDLDPLMDLIGDARFVLLGEASHGTHEYYAWRAEISKRLIREKGFRFIAVEGDWPDCYRVNRYIKGLPGGGHDAYDVLFTFNRWPTWMWANLEVRDLVDWLRVFNDSVDESRRAGFYGLDVYSLWESLEAVVRYLEKADGAAAELARRAYRCFEPFHGNEQECAWTTALSPHSCEDDVVRMLAQMRREAPSFEADGREAYFNAEQNALIARNAEDYYRAMVRTNSGSWNIRDRHMVETLGRLMDYHGGSSRAIVWAHNTHIGDARFTDMARRGEVNVGQLVRQQWPDDGVVLVGCGSHHGTVIAGDNWGAPMRRMPVPPGSRGTWEDVMHAAGTDDKLLLFDGSSRRGAAADWRGHRAIGVVYHPDVEHLGNYVPTVLPDRYDAFLYVDETRALRPIHMVAEDPEKVPETFPSAV